ncbi:MAG TPA: hypothetical protein VJ697_08840 [Nitrososphaeraceae archaeon]|jgi:hypothetical protein|nr:hypothetical protein [Nitrososphaeraceae archaeon]
MQYFTALKLGEKRVKESKDLLNKYTGNIAMPALALKDNKTNEWFPVGEENLIATFKESSGYVIVICDKNGVSKSLAQWFSEEDKNNIVSRIKQELNLPEYTGKLSLPI